MAVRLRLKRIGRTHRSQYRLNAMDGRAPRDGRVIEELGSYDPQSKDPDRQVSLKRDRIEYWLGVGAQVSETVRDLLARNGIEVRASRKRRPKVPSKAAPKEAEQQEQQESAEGS